MNIAGSEMETFVKFSSKPKLKKPILVEGLPGFGQVGRLVAEHLIKEFKGKQFAELYSPHFPPQVMIKNNGIIEMITNTFYSLKIGKYDFIVLVGEAQAATITGQYDICNKIIEVCKDLGCKEIITIGGYATGKLLKEPKIYGAANSSSLIKEYTKQGVIFKNKGNRGGIVGASGLLLGLGDIENMKAVCLMGETPGHPLLIDAKAAEAVLNIFSKRFNAKIDMGELDKRAKELERFRLGLERMMRKMMKREETEAAEKVPGGEKELKYIG